VSEPEIADQQYTLEHYLKRSKRKALPLALGFLQGKDGEPGPLKELTRRGRETALDQYLFAHAIASKEQEGVFDVRLPASTWARAIGGWFHPETGEVESAALHAVSRNWKLLRELKLVRTERVGGRVKVFLLADDGSGAPYEHVASGKRGKKLGGPGFLQLRYEYWYDGWHKRLSLPGKAMLLVCLYQGNAFPLPYDKVPVYYGISSATAQRGLRELQEMALLYREKHRRPEPEAPHGFTEVCYYELLPPFGPRTSFSKWKPASWRGPSGKPKRKAKSKRGKTDSPKRRKRTRK